MTMNTIWKSTVHLIVGVGLALLSGCGSDDPAAPTPEPAPMAEVTWEAARLNVIDDCDASAGTAEGDFYISFSLNDVTGGDEVRLAERRGVLVQKNSGEVAWDTEIGIALKAQIPLKDGTRLMLRMSFYENDSGGPQVSAGNAYHYTYSTEAGRWEAEFDDGFMEADAPDTVTLELADNSGDTCLAFLRGKFSQQAIGE